jgi:hypothetical protein
MTGPAWRVRSVEIVDDRRLSLQFADGLTGTVDLSDLFDDPEPGIFADLRDPALFRQVHLDHGAPTWPNGADLAPEGLYAAIRRKGVWTWSD